MGDFRSHLGNPFSLNQHLAGTDYASILDVKQSCRMEHDGLWLCLRVNDDKCSSPAFREPPAEDGPSRAQNERYTWIADPPGIAEANAC
jgi:hypothetical protein